MSEVQDDETYLAINKSREVAMRHIWLLLIWLLVVAIESLTYSAVVLSATEEGCSPIAMKQ